MPTPKKNQTLTLKIEALTAEGSGVGRSEGFAVFVRGGVPGDEVEAHVIKAKKHYAVAKVTRVLSASPHRIPNDCPLFPRCGGCALRELEYGFEAEESAVWRTPFAALRIWKSRARRSSPRLLPNATATRRNIRSPVRTKRCRSAFTPRARTV